jgi:hypothetical protein
MIGRERERERGVHGNGLELVECALAVSAIVDGEFPST